jgi:iron complex transport system substrate-binding protein
MPLIRRALPLLALIGLTAAAPAPRVLSLDQCADQFVLSLAPRQSIVGLSTRADDPDAFLRAQAQGLPRRRPSLESILAARPTVVVRLWEGDQRLISALQSRGIKVVTIDDAANFDGVRSDISKVAAALGAQDRGRQLQAELDRRLRTAAGAWKGRTALYLTPGGYTSGPGTLVDAILKAAGLANAETRPGFNPVPLEKLVLAPPSGLVLGFFDVSGATEHWAPVTRAKLMRLGDQRVLASLPGAVLSCPGPVAGAAVEMLAAGAAR